MTCRADIGREVLTKFISTPIAIRFFHRTFEPRNHAIEFGIEGARAVGGGPVNGNPLSVAIKHQLALLL